MPPNCWEAIGNGDPGDFTPMLNVERLGLGVFPDGWVGCWPNPPAKLQPQ